MIQLTERAATWTDELAEELHKPLSKNFLKRRVCVSSTDEIWAADWVDMQSFWKENKGIKYLFTINGVFSKYGWMVPLEQKTGIAVAIANALERVFTERKPDKLCVDKGKEIYNKDVRKLITIYSTENEEKSRVVER